MGILTKTLKSCKTDMCINIRRDEDLNYWLGSNHVMINMGKEFSSSETDVLTMLDLPQEKAEAVHVHTFEEIWSVPNHAAKPLEPLPYSLNINGTALQPFKCEQGTIFLPIRHIDIFKEFEKQGIEFYLAESGITVIVYSASALKGIIAPMPIEYDKLCAFASKLMKLTFKARKNGFLCAVEQTSLLNDEDDEADYDEG